MTPACAVIVGWLFCPVHPAMPGADWGVGSPPQPRVCNKPQGCESNDPGVPADSFSQHPLPWHVPDAPDDSAYQRDGAICFGGNAWFDKDGVVYVEPDMNCPPQKNPKP